MSALLWALVWVLAIVFALVIALLVTPVRLVFDLRTSPTWRLRIAARLLAGMTPSIPVHDSERSGSRRAPAEKQKSKARRKDGRGRRWAARPGRVIRSAPDLLVGLLKPIHLERFKVDADIGLEDPADTGHLFGLIQALDAVRPRPRAISIDVRPDFTGPRASGEVFAALRFIPAAFVWPGCRFAWRVFGAGHDR